MGLLLNSLCSEISEIRQQTNYSRVRKEDILTQYAKLCYNGTNKVFHFLVLEASTKSVSTLLDMLVFRDWKPRI